MRFAVSSRFTTAGAKKKAFSKKDQLARQAALEDVTRSMARIEKIAEQENIRKQTSALVEAAAVRLARSKGAVTSYRVIERRICKAFDLTPAEINSHRRNTKFVLARQAIMYWAKRLTPLTPQEIGRRMGGRDHSTVYHGIDAYPEKRAKGGRYLRQLPRISEFKGRRV